MPSPTFAAQSPLERLLLSFSEAVARDWLRQVFPGFSSQNEPLDVSAADYRNAGCSAAKRLGTVRLKGATGADVELPVFLATCAHLGTGPQRKTQFLCAQAMLSASWQGTGAAPVVGALIFFHAAGERRTRFSLITRREAGDKPLYRRQSFLLVPDLARNQTFRKAFGSGGVTAFGTPGEAVTRGRRETLLAKFSVEALTKEFYDRLFAWYEWAAKPATGVRFPDVAALADTDKRREALLKEHLIRLITRLMFVWFVKEKIGALARFFDAAALGKLLRDFRPTSATDGTYYNAILQNLFFATLNQPAEARAFATNRVYQGCVVDHGINTLFRDASPTSWFAESHAQVLEAFAPVPYLNGGLFECLDADDDAGHKVYHDGFSRKASARAFLPNNLFFDPTRGLLPLLAQYDFTIDENHATDADIALDPELLGKVFENLLASYNPETGASARKASGSFYTPREIVDYMIDEALRATLSRDFPADAVATLLKGDGATLPTETRQAMAERLRSLKTLDPACGSGAFPMGLLNRMVDLLGTLEGDAGNTYQRKLHLIQTCIYGVDIQPIAIQIAKLRFFIALLCDQPIDPNASNSGLDQLPNLETHLVIANTLVGIEGADDWLPTPEITALRAELQELRDRHLHVHSRAQKKVLRRRDRDLRRRLQTALAERYLRGTDLLAEWDPYNPCAAAPFFDAEWMFGFKNFGLVIGNPPYGAHLSTQAKAYFRKRYVTAQTIPGKQKGSVDTYTLFIERAFRLLKTNGTCTFIVPLSVTSSDSLSGVHNLLYANCEEIRVSSYAVRPQPIFLNATVNVSIVLFAKTETVCARLYATKMNRKEDGHTLDDILAMLSFVEVKAFCRYGRIPKIGTEIERNILQKLASHPTIGQKETLIDCAPLYYRVTGGRYFKVVTPFSTGSTKEGTLFLKKNEVRVVGACLSSSLGFWFYQIYSNNLDWKQCEVKAFPIPAMTAEQQEGLKGLYDAYLADIERNATTHETSWISSYQVDAFKAYHIGRSIAFIDRLDDFLGPLYGLSPEEVAFIKNYERSFRLHAEDMAAAATVVEPEDEEL